jgi:hypothetical protein
VQGRWLQSGVFGRLLFLFGWILSLLPTRSRAENHADYRFEYYSEENNRITVNTHSVYFEQQLIDAVIARGELTYDGISGATPTGAKPAPGGKVPMVNLTDIRRAANIGLDLKWGPQTITPQFAYSKESDYESRAVSLSDAIEFNQKNTTLQFGASHNFDRVLDDASPRVYQDKAVTAGIVGVSQLLTPKTILSADFTYTTESGFLSDPYRLATFDTFGFAYHEHRPGHKTGQIFLLSLRQYIEPVHASIEGSYRFYHDSYDVYSHTMELIWHQQLGKHVLLEPLFRFNEQSAASFYATSFSGIGPAPNQFFSSDYRLSELYSLDYGLRATIIATDWLRFNLGYHRYEMYGLDGKTASGMYPKANVVTAGLQLWF